MITHSGHEDMSKYRVRKATLYALEIDAACDSIDGNNFSMGLVGEGSRESDPIVPRERESNELDLVVAQIVADAGRFNEYKRMVEARKGVKGKAKVPVIAFEDRSKLVGGVVQGGLSSGGQLVIKENILVVDIDEAVRKNGSGY